MNQQKKSLTHLNCIFNHGVVFDLLISGMFVALSVFLLFVWKDSLTLFSILFVSMFGGIPLVTLFIPTLSKMIMIMSGNYYIYVDVVCGRRISASGPDTDGLILYLQFANNSFEKTISNKEYNTVKDGTPYYLIQINDEDKAVAAYPVSKYCLHPHIQKHFKRY